MKKIEKVLWAKFGWSEFYRGGLVDGNFPYIFDGSQGHEAWNFQPLDDAYYCYVPPQGPSAATPWSSDNTGWTVICLAKKPDEKGIHVVGWLEDATLEVGTVNRAGGYHGGTARPSEEIYSYFIRSHTAYLVPLEHRTRPFSHPSVRQSKYSYISGPEIDVTKNKQEVLSILSKELKRLRPLVAQNPNLENLPDVENNESDPLGGFGTAEHRKLVETKAVEATKLMLEKFGFDWESKEPLNLGYDLLARHPRTGETLHVEVKGTSGQLPRFFLTSNERIFSEAPSWRLAMVTDALGDPKVRIYTHEEYSAAFEVLPMVWKGVQKTPS